MSDNKKYVGKIDRIRVSMSEEYEVDDYVAHYIKSNGYGNTAENRHALHDHINSVSP